MMKVKALLAAFLFSAAIGVAAPQQADNTKMNQEQSKGATADKAKNNKSDLEIMRQIRRAVVKDKSLSTDAKNVKIVAQSGQVTLKGPVKTDDEKKAIEQKATEIAGAGKVTNEITIKGQ